MEENVFDSIDAIDAQLDEEFGEVANEPEETPVEEAVEENAEVEEPESEQIDEPEETEEVPQVEDEGEAESKKDHAFSSLRAENSSLKRERDGYKADSDYLKELAASYGYDDVAKFQEAIRLSKYQREAQEKGYDPALYKKTMEQERRIAQLEKEREDTRTQMQLDKFQAALSNASKNYNVDEKEILSRLEDSGVTVDQILNFDNHKLLIDGVLIDKIQNHAEQSQIENLQNLKNLAEDKNEQDGVETTVTIESLLKDDLAKYKRDNYFD